MDSETTIICCKTFSKKRVFILILSVVNLYLLLALFSDASSNHYKIKNSSIGGLQLIIFMIFTLIVLFFIGILSLIKAVWIRNICHIKYCLEYFILLFVLNNIPIISMNKRVDTVLNPYIKFRCSDNTFGTEKMCYWEKENTTEDYRSVYDFISLSFKLLFVMIVLEMYFVYLYYNYELKYSQQNLTPTPQLCENPSASMEACQMACSHNIALETHQCISQPTGQNTICHPRQNATQKPIHYIMQQPGQYVTQQLEQYETQQPVSSAYIPPHIPNNVQMHPHPNQSMTSKPRQELNQFSELSITKNLVKVTNPPPYY